ncbi:MAG: hypothetical protein R2724_00930 [Bryobacterales bacterium]
MRAILTQAGPSLEVLLLEINDGRYPPLEGSDDPRVRRYSLASGVGYGEAGALAIREARAPVVAFVEEHVQVAPGWAAAMVDAHRGPWAAVCGELHAGDRGRAIADRIELISRHAWSPPAQGGESDLLRWQNVCYKRAPLLRYGPRLELLLQGEGALFRQLRADGERLYIEPRAKAIHAHETDWSAFLRGTFYSNRVSHGSGVEVAPTKWAGFWRPLASTLAGPVRWPLVLWRRTCAMPEAAHWRKIYWQNLPYVLQYYAVAAVAGATGVLFGKGSSASQFLNAELNYPRLIPDRSRWLAEEIDAA